MDDYKAEIFVFGWKKCDLGDEVFRATLQLNEPSGGERKHVVLSPEILLFVSRRFEGLL